MKKILILLSISMFMLSATSKVRGVKRVVWIGTDGFAGFAIEKFPQLLPNIMNLINNGSSTIEARSVLPSSSAVNWASLNMGAGPELHGFTTWGSKKPDVSSITLNEYGMFPDIWGLMREEFPKGEMGYLYTWDGMKYLYSKDAVNFDYQAKNDKDLVDKYIEYLKIERPILSFVCFAEPDGVGHGKGWETQEYKDMCQTIDGYVGEIIKTLEQNDMMDETVVIFTSDHGGKGKVHGGKTLREMQVPYVLYGKNVKKNFKITEPHMAYDNAPTIAYIFGAETPDIWQGRPFDEVFK